MISKDYAAARRALIDRAARRGRADARRCAAGAGDTVYLAAADGDGNMVSLIQSNYMGFGSGVTVAPFGFGLQNRGSQFALDPKHANAYAPGKRPFHTIIPAFAMRDGEALLAFGVMGAAMQPQGQVQVLIEHARLRHGAAGRRRRAARAPRRLDGADGRPSRFPAAAPCISSPASPRRRSPSLRARGHRIEPDGHPRRVRRLSSDPARPAHRRVFSARPSRARTVTPRASDAARSLGGGRRRRGGGISGQKRSRRSEIVGGDAIQVTTATDPARVST